MTVEESGNSNGEGVLSLRTNWLHELENDPNFDVSLWIKKLIAREKNNTVDSINLSDPANKAVIPRILLSLSVEREKVAKEMEDSIFNFVSSALPSLLTDIAKIKGSMTTLFKEFSVVKKDMNRFQSESHGSFDILMKMDLKRQRISRVRTALIEVEKWKTISADCDAAFQDGNLERAAILLEEMRKGASSSGTLSPDKKKLLEVWTKRLWKDLDPSLTSAIKNRDSEKSKVNYQIIVETMKFPQVFEKNWAALKKEAVIQRWKEICEKSITDLPNFYESLLGEIVEDVGWLSPIVNDKDLIYRMTILRPIGESFPLLGLEEMLKSGLEQNFTQNYPKFMQLLVKGSIDFSKQLEYHVLTLNSSLDISLAEFHGTAKAIFDMFLGMWKGYRDNELRFIGTERVVPVLASLNFKSSKNRKNLFENVREAMQSVTEEFFVASTEAIERCLACTFGFGISELIQAVSKTVVVVSQKVTNLIQELRSYYRSNIVSIRADGTNEISHDDIIFLRTGLALLEVMERFQLTLSWLSGHIVREMTKNACFEYIVKVDESDAWFRQEFSRRKSISSSLSGRDGGVSKSLYFIVFMQQSAWNCSESLQSLAQKFRESTSATDTITDNIFSKDCQSSLVTTSRICQIFLYDVLFRFIDYHVTQMGKSSVWMEKKFPVQVAEQMSPTSGMILMGEHLLSLPQYLEFPEDEAEAEEVGRRDSEFWNRLGRQLGKDHSTLSFSVQSLPYLKIFGQEQGGSGESFLDEDPMYLWMRSLAYGTVSRFLEFTLELGALTSFGARQLSVDWRYLENILDSMEIEWPTTLQPLSTWLNLESVKDLQENLSDENLDAEQSAWLTKIIEMRLKGDQSQ